MASQLDSTERGGQERITLVTETGDQEEVDEEETPRLVELAEWGKAVIDLCH